eukprot:CAMPEP_0171747932 /NCGR_PEP_ID=MMETSP0991-20121206/39785_1 /TAXON_ID=483369 /ORGANISM="non described non described, Strain CCMP2098" /LENGTH=303 /DNA_ID=CAMNT_0012348159 /DNA_START=67 /DNA_END=978 /DNA_ORIENTATION=+
MTRRTYNARSPSGLHRSLTSGSGLYRSLIDSPTGCPIESFIDSPTGCPTGSPIGASYRGVQPPSAYHIAGPQALAGASKAVGAHEVPAADAEQVRACASRAAAVDSVLPRERGVKGAARIGASSKSHRGSHRGSHWSPIGSLIESPTGCPIGAPYRGVLPPCAYHIAGPQTLAGAGEAVGAREVFAADGRAGPRVRFKSRRVDGVLPRERGVEGAARRVGQLREDVREAEGVGRRVLRVRWEPLFKSVFRVEEALEERHAHLEVLHEPDHGEGAEVANRLADTLPVLRRIVRGIFGLAEGGKV